MPEVLSITYHDLLNDGRVQAGDSINIHLRAHVQTLQFHLILTDVAGGTVRILTLWFAGNGSVPIPISPQVPFADAIVLEKQIHISFGNVSEARGIAEFLVYIEDVTPGTFWTSSQWRSAVNNSSNLAFCGDGPNPLSHIASLTYRDIMENGRIDQGDELHLTLSDSTPVGHTYRIALRLTSNGSWGASVDFVFDGQ
jgi:hypothetical protein